MGEVCSTGACGKCDTKDLEGDFDVISAYEEERDEIESFINENYGETTPKKKSRRSRKGRRSSKKSRSKTRMSKIDSDSTMEEEKRSTESEFDERDIIALLPAEPTIREADGRKKNLKLMIDARSHAIDLWNMIDSDEWKLIKETHIQLYKLKRQLAASEVFIKRIMTVEAPINTVVSLFEDCDFQLE